MQTIYQQLKILAKPILKAYKEDLTIHDKKDIQNAKPGDKFIWFCRESGTQLSKLNNKKKFTKFGIAHYCVFGNYKHVENYGYLITVTEKHYGTVKRVKLSDYLPDNLINLDHKDIFYVNW